MINCPFLFARYNSEHNALFKDKFDGRGSRISCVCMRAAGGSEIDPTEVGLFFDVAATEMNFHVGVLIMSSC